MEPIIAEARKYNFTPNCVQLIPSISRKSRFDNFIDGYTDVNVYFKRICISFLLSTSYYTLINAIVAFYTYRVNSCKNKNKLKGLGNM